MSQQLFAWWPCTGCSFAVSFEKPSWPQDLPPLWFAQLKLICWKHLMSYVLKGRCVYQIPRSSFPVETEKGQTGWEPDCNAKYIFMCHKKGFSFFFFSFFSSGIHISISIKAQSEEEEKNCMQCLIPKGKEFNLKWSFPTEIEHLWGDFWHFMFKVIADKKLQY